MSDSASEPVPAEFLTYETFGRRFFEIAVTEERVGAAIGEIAGEAFEMGPIAQGPGRLAKVTAKVNIRQPRVSRQLGELITFAIRIPLEIDMVVDLRIDKPKFIVFGEIALRATAKAAEPLLLILDGVEDPRNLGAILRTAEGAGVDGVIIPERRAVGLNDTVAKSSAGAIEYVKVAKAGNLNRLIEDLKARDIWVVGTSMDSTMSYDEWDWTRPSALVLGGEGSGLHRLVAENCDVLVKIPMYGRIDSLNVSVAAGVILFEARRQRSKDE